MKPWNDNHWKTVICDIKQPVFLLGSPWLEGREAIILLRIAFVF
jgi:hypothetical protein